MKINTTETESCAVDVRMSQFFQDCKDIQYYIAAYKKKPSSNKKKLIKGMVFNCAYNMILMNKPSSKLAQEVLLQHYLMMYNAKLNLNSL